MENDKDIKIETDEELRLDDKIEPEQEHQVKVNEKIKNPDRDTISEYKAE